jgi:hypothetical protein
MKIWNSNHFLLTKLTNDFNIIKEDPHVLIFISIKLLFKYYLYLKITIKILTHEVKKSISFCILHIKINLLFPFPMNVFISIANNKKVRTGVLTQGFILAKQVLYCLSHTSSSIIITFFFVSVCFGDGVLLTTCKLRSSQSDTHK